MTLRKVYRKFFIETFLSESGPDNIRYRKMYIVFDYSFYLLKKFSGNLYLFLSIQQELFL